MARKIFISVLGTGFYKPCIYGQTNVETRFIQVATLLHINAREWSNDDAGYIFLTDGARSANWEIAGNKRKNHQNKIEEDYQSLKPSIDKLELPFQVNDIHIPEGKNEDEMWEIFSTIFDVINEGDELYIDLTHGYRYLPMLVLVLTNYAKFLKKVNVKSLTYGGFEAPTKEGIKPIMDLLPIAALQDWTNAAAAFQNGNASQLAKLTTSELRPILRDHTRPEQPLALALRFVVENLEKVTSEMQTCRGLSIEKACSIKTLKKHLDNMHDVIIKPVEPIIDKVKEEFVDFNENPDVKNGFVAAKWCINHGLYQQATTMLQESVVSYFCNLYNQYIIDCSLIEDKRSIISSALNILADKMPENEWQLNKPEHLSLLKDVVEAFNENQEAYMVQCDNGKREHISVVYKNLASGLRNDVNHNGMRNNPLSPNKIKNKTEDFYNRIYSCLYVK